MYHQIITVHYIVEAVPKWKAEGVRGFWARIALQHGQMTMIFAKVEYNPSPQNPYCYRS